MFLSPASRGSSRKALGAYDTNAGHHVAGQKAGVQVARVEERTGKAAGSADEDAHRHSAVGATRSAAAGAFDQRCENDGRGGSTAAGSGAGEGAAFGASRGFEALAGAPEGDALSDTNAGVMVDVSAIPDVLIVEVRLPDATILPPVSAMMPTDCVRELAAVYCMREAETAAALEACDRSASPASFMSPGGVKRSNVSAAGSLEVSVRALHCIEGAPGVEAEGARRPPTAASPRAHGSASSGFSSGSTASPMHSQLDDAEADERRDGSCGVVRGYAPLSHRGPGGAELDRIALDTTYCEAGTAVFNSEQWLSTRSVLLVRAAAGAAPSHLAEVPASLLTSTSMPSPTVRLILSLPSGLNANVAAFDVPRPGVDAGLPYVGAAAAQDAVSALRSLLSAAVPCASSAGGGAHLPVGLETPSSVMARITTAVSLLRAHVRPWIHSGLSPSSSETRVQQLVDRIKDLTGYDATPPMAPLAQTRLGTAHPLPSRMQGHREGRGDATASLTRPSPGLKRYLASGSASTLRPSSRAAHVPAPSHAPSSSSSSSSSWASAALGTPMTTRSVRKGEEGSAGTCGSIQLEGGLALSLPSSSGFHSPSMPRGPTSALRRPTTGACMGRFPSTPSSLLSPQLMDAVPACSLTPPRTSVRVLARYVSCRDRTRDGADPASLDREYHAQLLGTMQGGLTAMSEQRRAEEGHMLASTRVKPAKDTRTGGYMYISALHGGRVDPHDYEHVYLREVNFASEYISEQAAVLWTEEATAEKARRAALVDQPEELALELARASRVSASRLSWWEQDVEEGYSLGPGSVALGEGLQGGSSTPAVPSNDATTTIGSLLQEAVVSWIGAVQDARVSAALNAIARAEDAARTRAAALEQEEGAAIIAASPCNDEGEVEIAASVGGATRAAAAATCTTITTAQLALAVRAALPTLLAPLRSALGSPITTAADMAAVERALLANLSAYASSLGLDVVVGREEGGEGSSTTTTLHPSAPLLFTFSGETGFTFGRPQQGGSGVEGEEGDGSSFDSAADSDAILSDAIRSFAGLSLSEPGAQQQQQLASSSSLAGLALGATLAQAAGAAAASAGGSLSGILLQLLPANSGPSALFGTTSGWEGPATSTFPKARLFDSTTAPFFGPQEAWGSHEEGVEESRQGHSTVIDDAEPEAAYNDGEPAVEPVGGNATDGGDNSASTGFSTTAFADGSHGSVPVRIRFVGLHGEEAASSFSSTSSSAASAASAPDDRSGSPFVAPSDDTHEATRGATLTAEATGAPTSFSQADALGALEVSDAEYKATLASAGPPATPGRIAPSVLKVFSPQPVHAAAGLSTAAGSSGSVGTRPAARLPAMTLLSPSLAARVQAATESLSLPVPSSACAAEGGPEGSKLSGAYSLPPLPFSSPVGVTRSYPHSSVEGGATATSFSLRTAEALRIFDEALNGFPAGSGGAGGAAHGHAVVTDARALLKAASGAPAPTLLFSHTALDADAGEDAPAPGTTAAVPAARGARALPRPLPGSEGGLEPAAAAPSSFAARILAKAGGGGGTTLPLVSPVRLTPLSVQGRSSASGGGV